MMMCALLLRFCVAAVFVALCFTALLRCRVAALPRCRVAVIGLPAGLRRSRALPQPGAQRGAAGNFKVNFKGNFKDRRAQAEGCPRGLGLGCHGQREEEGGKEGGGRSV